MANLEILSPFILAYEGGFGNHPADHGGPTNRGVTLTTWRSCGYDKDGDGDIDVDDLKLISAEDAVERVMRPYFWQRWRADEIRLQCVANLVVDWCWLSGPKTIKYVQSLIGVKADGIVGPVTLKALNNLPLAMAYGYIYQRRLQFIENIVTRDPSQQVFRTGWLRRLNAIGTDSLRLPDKSVISFDKCGSSYRRS